MKKKCSNCKEEKGLEEFNKNKARKDGHNTFCKICSTKNSRTYYKINGERHRKHVIEKKRERLKKTRAFILSVLCSSNCKDCGNTDRRVLEFDHVRGKKRKDVSKLLAEGFNIEHLKEEIEKCDVVCANCHRIRTMTRNPTYRNKI